MILMVQNYLRQIPLHCADVEIQGTCHFATALITKMVLKKTGKHVVENKINHSTNKAIKLLFVSLGLISLGLGITGIFLPLLPTTPFLLLSAALFMRSSKRLYNWLINHKYLGTHIQNYIHHKTISKRSKIMSLILLWVTILASIFFVVHQIYLKLLLLFIAIAVCWHILSFKSTKE